MFGPLFTFAVSKAHIASNAHERVRSVTGETMAKNDTILLDGIIDERIEQKLPSDRRDEVFEYLSYEQLLKDYDLSSDEIKSGSIDGRNDGGIDGFFIFVNGHLLTDSEVFLWPKAGCEIEVWIVNCKHHDTFLQAPLDKLNASFYELLDFSLSEDDLKGDYSFEVLAKRTDLIQAYRKLSPRLNRFSLSYIYASRGDASEVGDAIQARAEQLVEMTRSNFSSCEASFSFIGASELVELHRQRPNFSLELPYVELLSRGENYILLSRLKDYFDFVSDRGKLRRYLFDSNVRDFMGLNRVNEDIRDTLSNEESPDFWWLNNGVTILASGASVIGKSIKLSDIQIVNGLQSTESIHRHFRQGLGDKNDRAVLVKVIVSNDDADRDAIIRSTNNQTFVELASLHATDKIQRDIEEVLFMSGLYYERRKNYYVNLGHSAAEVVTPLYIAAGFVALALKNPQKAVGLRSRFMRTDESYNTVFSEKTPITLWPTIGKVLKRVDRTLELKRPSQAAGEHFLKGWRYISAFCVVASHFGTFNYSQKQLNELHADDIPDDNFSDVVDVLWEVRNNRLSNKQWAQAVSVRNACQAITDRYGTKDLDEWLHHGRKELHERARKKMSKNVSVTQEFVEKVDSLLPAQPWKPGTEVSIVKALGCTRDEYFAATSRLINDGRRNKQKDGVVYDANGEVLCVDPERVDPNTLQLIKK